MFCFVVKINMSLTFELLKKGKAFANLSCFRHPWPGVLSRWWGFWKGLCLPLSVRAKLDYSTMGMCELMYNEYKKHTHSCQNVMYKKWTFSTFSVIWHCLHNKVCTLAFIFFFTPLFITVYQCGTSWPGDTFQLYLAKASLLFFFLTNNL